MRRNNRRMFFNDDKETNKILIVSSIILGIAILAFIITFVIYRNYLNNQSEISKSKIMELTEISKLEPSELSQASSTISKSINEIETDEESKENIENIEKIAINTSNMEKQMNETEQSNTDNNENEIEQSTKKIQANNEDIAKNQEKIPDPVFRKPVEGNITTGFAKDTLVYSNTLQEWVVHNGIDIEAEKTSIVVASEAGTIKTIKNDPRYGITVVIDHVNGYSTVYSNLLTAEFIKEGEKVEKGQTIATVGNTAIFEIADKTHLHFEILKDGEYIDPENYI